MKIEKKAAKAFGTKIRALRKHAGLSQEKLAAEAGVSANYMGQIERGECNVSLHLIARLAQTLGVRIMELFSPR